MKRSESIGNEYLKHEQRLEDIKVFFDLIEKTELKPGAEFTEGHTETNLYCVSIDYDNLSIQCSSVKKETYTEMDLIHLPINNIRDFFWRTITKA